VVRVENTEARAVDVPVNVLDCTRARRHLGWSARTALGEGLRRTCEWLRATR
jgi:UDP-glucose 4-epimerase